MVAHDLRYDRLCVLIYFHKHSFFALFAPREQFVIFLLEFVIYFNGCLESPFCNKRIESFPNKPEVLSTTVAFLSDF